MMKVGVMVRMEIENNDDIAVEIDSDSISSPTGCLFPYVYDLCMSFRWNCKGSNIFCETFA